MWEKYSTIFEEDLKKIGIFKPNISWILTMYDRFKDYYFVASNSKTMFLCSIYHFKFTFITLSFSFATRLVIWSAL